MYWLISSRYWYIRSAWRALEFAERYLHMADGMYWADEEVAGFTTPSRGTETCSVVETMFSMRTAYVHVLAHAHAPADSLKGGRSCPPANVLKGRSCPRKHTQGGRSCTPQTYSRGALAPRQSYPRGADAEGFCGGQRGAISGR